jgi:hypothetical protein
MLDRIKNNQTVFLTFAILTLLLTGPLTLMTVYEYINVGIFKNTNGYPFGQEGPVAGVEHYKSADAYVKHTLTTGLILLPLFVLNLYFVIKHKAIGLFLFGTILFSLTIINFITNLSELD